MYPQRSVMTCGLATALKPPHFNHAPVRGAIGAIQYVAGYVTKFQSTHPRGVRRDGQPPDCRCGDVSIHAPAWGATEIPEGVRIQAECFNPRTRVGCDARYDEVMDALGQFQSTHPRGVRPCTQRGLHGPRCFNPRTRVGCDFRLACMDLCGVGFNPRTRVGCDLERQAFAIHIGEVSIHAPAWGATPGRPCGSRTGQGFNPRTRVGCDVSMFYPVDSRD